MNVTCKNILSLPYVNQLKLLAGKEGLNHVISGVYYTEGYQLEDQLKGGELVIIKGMMAGEKGILLNLINALYEKNVAGVVINLSSYIREIPQAIIDRGDFLGLPVFEMPAKLSIVDVSKSICLAIFKEESFQHDINEILSEVLSGGRITEKRLKRLETAGFLPGAMYNAIVIRIRENGTMPSDPETAIEPEELYQETQWDWKFHWLDQLICEYLGMEQVLSTADGDSYIWIIAGNEILDPWEFRKSFPAYLHNRTVGTSYLIGVGNSFRDLKHMKSSVDNAQQAIRLGQSKNPKGEMFLYEIELGRRVMKLEEKGKLPEVASQILQDLMLPEREELLRTLIQYVRCGFRTELAAEALSIHENTVHDRLHKIEELLKVDLKNPSDIIKLSMAVEIVRTTQN